MFTAERILGDLRSDRCKKVILDTDTFNEIDDQYALVHLLMSSDRCRLLGVCAAPYLNDRSVSAADGEQKSYNEAVKIIRLTDETLQVPVFHGSQSFLSDRESPVESPAADFIIRSALQFPEEPVYIVTIGAGTNVASALLKAPEIADNVVVVWLAANLPEVGRNIEEFNLREDVPAGQAIFESRANLVLLPMAVTANVYISQADMKGYLLKNPRPVCRYLYEEWCSYVGEEQHGKVVWDLAGSGAVMVPEAFGFEVVLRPLLGDDSEYLPGDGKSEMILLRSMRAALIFEDWFRRVKG